MGEVEEGVCNTLEKELGAVSQGFHGGSFNGPALRMVFWGREREPRRGVKASYDWNLCVTKFTDWLATQPEGDEGAEVVRKQVNAYHIPICKHFDTASNFILSTKFTRTDAEMRGGEVAIAEVVRLWRELAKPGTGGSESEFKRLFNVGWSVKLKHHLLEVHVLPFIKEHGCAGAFSESAIESFHRLCNTMERTWVSISKPQERWRTMLGRAAINAEAGAKESGADRLKQGDQKKHKKL